MDPVLCWLLYTRARPLVRSAASLFVYPKKPLTTGNRMEPSSFFYGGLKNEKSKRARGGGPDDDRLGPIYIGR